MADVKDSPVDFDVIVVGAGISGINAGYRIQTQLPGSSYTILEARGGIGGTWDLFKYPGIRSDSDLHTFGFPWRPWSSPKAIASGDSIVKYVRECAEVNGIDQHIQFHHKLIAADWSSEHQAWTLEVDANGTKKFIRGRFVLLSTGYYNYSQALPVDIPGIDSFKGKVIHPQFWPEDLSYANKDIVVIGSGATAITLIPSLTETASHVTMLQRSPSYIISAPSVDPSGQLAHKWLPQWLAFKLVRIKFLLLPFFFFNFCRSFPNAARKIISKGTKRELPPSVPHDPHFKPKYNPWEQRLCVCPDGDFFKSLRSGKASIVTSAIDKVTENSIVCANGETLSPDIIVTATGLKIQIAGGASVSVDGVPMTVGEKFLWKGVMLQDLPNLATVIGYTNASWTLGADATAQHVTRLINYMKKKGVSSATPRVKDGTELTEVPVLNLKSTYVERGKSDFPKAAMQAPWQPRSTYFADMWEARWGTIDTGLQLVRVGSK